MDTLEPLKLFHQPGWDVFPCFRNKRFVAFCPLPRKECRVVLKSTKTWLALVAANFQFPEARLYHLDGGFFQIPAASLNSDCKERAMFPIRNGRPHLVDATRWQVAQFIAEQREVGKLVVVTSQVTNKCVDIDLINPERGIFRYASQWYGMNFLELWRDSMQQYQQLRQLLDTEGYIPQFNYELLRIDGSKGRYWKDYYLANNFLQNEPVRISVGHQSDWEIVK